MLHFWEEQALGYLHNPAKTDLRGSGQPGAEWLGLKSELSFPSGCPASGTLLRVLLVFLTWATPDNNPWAGIASQEEKAPAAPEQVALLELPHPALH